MKIIIMCWFISTLMLPLVYANELEEKVADYYKVGPYPGWAWSKTFYHSASGPGPSLNGQEKIFVGEIDAPEGYVMCGFYVKDIAINRNGYWKVGTNLENKDKYFVELVARSGPIVDQFGSSVRITLTVAAVPKEHARFPSQQQFSNASDDYGFWPQINYEGEQVIDCPLNKQGVGRFGMVRKRAAKLNEYWSKTNIYVKPLKESALQAVAICKGYRERIRQLMSTRCTNVSVGGIGGAPDDSGCKERLGGVVTSLKQEASTANCIFD